MSREKTTVEVRADFLAHVRGMVDFWKDENPESNSTERKDMEWRLSGLAFSILAALDGTSAGIPGFIVAPFPHPDDKQYNINEGDNWYPQNHEVEGQIKADISGSLHEEFYR